MKRSAILSRIFASPGIFLTVVALGIIAVTGITALFRSSHESTRTRALTNLASQTGFTFKGEEANVIDADLAATFLIENRKDHGTSLNAMEGTVAGLRTRLLDYRYQAESNDSEGEEQTHPVAQTVAAFASADRKLPRFRLQEYSRKNSFDLTGEEASHHVEFEGHPEFSKRFILISEESAETARIFTPQLRSFLMSSYPRGDWCMEGSGSWLVLYQIGVRVEPKDWQGFLNQTSQAADGFFKAAAP